MSQPRQIHPQIDFTTEQHAYPGPHSDIMDTPGQVSEKLKPSLSATAMVDRWRTIEPNSTDMRGTVYQGMLTFWDPSVWTVNSLQIDPNTSPRIPAQVRSSEVMRTFNEYLGLVQAKLIGAP